MELNLNGCYFLSFFELRGPTFILECPICLDYEEVILRESEQVRIFVKWHHFCELRPYTSSRQHINALPNSNSDHITLNTGKPINQSAQQYTIHQTSSPDITTLRNIESEAEPQSTYDMTIGGAKNDEHVQTTRNPDGHN